MIWATKKIFKNFQALERRWNVDIYLGTIKNTVNSTLGSVTRGTRGENIFNNKIYIGDLASN